MDRKKDGWLDGYKKYMKKMDGWMNKKQMDGQRKKQMDGQEKK